MRIAQTVIAPVLQVNVHALAANELASNEKDKSDVGSRGTGGFGSTGHD